MFKKLFIVIAVILTCTASVFAKSQYAVEVNITTKQVTIVQDGKVISGTHNEKGNLGTIKITKDGANKMICTLESFKGVEIPGVEPCIIEDDGSISFYGLNYKDAAIKNAFSQAMAYLKKTDEPITVQIFDGK